MIGVRMRERDHVDTALPWREHRAELVDHARRVGSSIDERDGAGDLDQVGIALTDIERDDAHPGRHRPGRERRGRRDRQREHRGEDAPARESDLRRGERRQ